MKPKKKSSIFTFLCSFLPGAAEMYMGFMKLGSSLMALFFVSFMISAMFNGSSVFVFLAFIIWFYGFFHARNMAACDEEAFALLEDKFIWEEFTEGKPVKIPERTGRKWIAAILILFGVGILWNNFKNIIYNMIPDSMWEAIYPIVDNIPKTVIAIAVIIIGVKMILGKKEELGIEETSEDTFKEDTFKEEDLHGEEN